MADQDFFASVRGALTHLYDPDYLRGCRLAQILDLAGQFDAPTVLQRILINVIEGIKPAPGSAGYEELSELHELLTYRYVQQFSQEEVAHQLGVSVRHLRRRQNAAIYLVASALWEAHDLGRSGLLLHAMAELPQVESPGDKDGDLDADEPDAADGIEGLSWLAQSSRFERTELRPALAALLELYKPLAQANGVQVIVEGAQETAVAVHPVAFQQSVLQLLSLATSYARNNVIRLDIAPIGNDVQIRLACATPWQPHRTDLEALAVIDSVVTLCGGRLQAGAVDALFSASITFPAARPLNVVVIEDNRELVDVMRRYAAGTRFSIKALNPVVGVLQVVEASQPDVLVMDIMMPELDGLQLLTEIRQHSTLASVPVIVCSVLPQAALAKALGAVAFVAKPFKQVEFLEALAGALTEAKP
jgi:CheY-like chemotaxis protein/transcriptional regulator with XRE-family HTH domain